MTKDLDLNDPKVAELIAASDVDKNITPVDPEIEKGIEDLKHTKFTITLKPNQLSQLQREASTLGIPWKDHFSNLIDSEVFDKRVGTKLINRPSKYSKTISGPSTESLVRRA